MPERKEKPQKEPSGTVKTEYHPAWLDTIVPDRLNNPELYRIVTFFVFHSPCKMLSAMSRPLVHYGWTEPWKKTQGLKRKLKDASTNPNLLFSSMTQQDMRQALEKAGLLDLTICDYTSERIAFYNNQKNQFMSVFYHIRDAFAHGRLSMRELESDSFDYAFLLEDVKMKSTKSTGIVECTVTARMVLRKSTLLKWIDIIESGPKSTEQ